MAINFPTSLDVFTDPTASDQLNLPSHSGQHTDLNNAVEALEAKVGADSSAVTSSHDYKIAQLEARTSGKILQVVSTTKTDTFSSSLAAGASTTITGLSANITPSSTDSKILVSVNVTGALGSYPLAGFIVKRDGTAIGVGDTAGSRTSVSAITHAYQTDPRSIAGISSQHLDSPASTSALSYTVDIANITGVTRTAYVNRTDTDTNAASYARGASTITVMEVAG